MGIKEERPSERRMMLRFNAQFLEHLPIFKRGFHGNEIPLLLDEMKAVELRRDLKILDIGSADGEWLGKTVSTVWSTLDFREVQFAALEPVSENPLLEGFCERNDIRWFRSRLEEAVLEEEEFDVITATHSAYYFFNQPLAHEALFRALKPGGYLVVTLVAKHCVLNMLTREILDPYRQFALTAESYITLVDKLGLFSLERVKAYHGGFDPDFFGASDEHLVALVNVLARHRLPRAELESSLGRLRGALSWTRGLKRTNLIMIFNRPAASSGTSSLRGRWMSRAGMPLESLRKIRELVAELLGPAGDKDREVADATIDALENEVARAQPRIDFVDLMRGRLLSQVVERGGEHEGLQQALDELGHNAREQGR